MSRGKRNRDREKNGDENRQIWLICTARYAVGKVYYAKPFYRLGDKDL